MPVYKKNIHDNEIVSFKEWVQRIPQAKIPSKKIIADKAPKIIISTRIKSSGSLKKILNVIIKIVVK